MFGGQNVSSYKIFRGLTAGGVYIDEANQCHPNTVAESFNRTIVSSDRRHIWTLNPDVPAHWVYADYLDRYDEEKPDGYKWFHFNLDDNDSIIFTEADITDLYPLDDIVRRSDVVIHAAAIVSFDPRDFKTMHKVNVEGTKNVVMWPVQCSL